MAIHKRTSTLPVASALGSDDRYLIEQGGVRKILPAPTVHTLAFSPSTAAVNRAAIQASLDLGGVVKFVLDEVYILDTTLTIGSNTIIDLGAATLQCEGGGESFPLIMNKNTAQSLTSLSGDGTTATATFSGHGYQPGQAVQIADGTPDTMDGFYFVATVTDSTFTFASSVSGSIAGATVQGDHNITVQGGTIDYNNDNTTGIETPYTGFLMGNMGTLWINVSELFLDHNHFQDAAKFAVGCWNVSKVHVSYPVFNTDSDGVHFNAPAKNCTVTMPRGTTGDDFVACTCGEYPDYDYTGGGDIEGILVDGAQPDSVGSTNVLKIAGKTGYSVKRVKVRNVDVTFTGAASAIVRLINDAVGSLTGTHAEDIIIDGCSLLDGDFGRILSATGANTLIDRAIISNCSINSSAALKGVYLDDSAEIGDLLVSNMTMQGGATNNIYLLDLRSTIGSVSLLNVVGRSIDRILNEDTTKNDGTIYAFNNVVLDDTTRTTYFQKNATVFCNNFVVTNAVSATYSPIYTLAGDIEVHGNIDFQQGNAVRESGGGGSIVRVNGLGIRTAIAAMTGGSEANGDVFFDLTSDKPAVWTGAAYVSLIDGTAL